MNTKKIPGILVLSFSITLATASQFMWTWRSTMFLICLSCSFLSVILEIKNKYNLEIKALKKELEKAKGR